MSDPGSPPAPSRSRWTNSLPGRLLVALLTMCLPILLAASAPEAASRRIDGDQGRVVAEAIRAYGGETALRKVRTVYALGYIETFMMNDVGLSIRHFERPRKLRAELIYHQSTETRVLNGTRGWRGSSGGPLAEMQGPPYLAMAYQYKYLDFPLGLLDENYSITNLGRGVFRGVAVDILRVADNEGPVMHLYLDAQSHLIVRVSGAFTMGGGGTELAAEFADFRKVDGVLFPFRITNYGGETKLSETTITELHVNQEMDPALFIVEQSAQPKGGKK